MSVGQAVGLKNPANRLAQTLLTPVFCSDATHPPDSAVVKRRPTPINPGSYHTRARPSEGQVGKPASLRSGIRKNKRPPDLNPEGACRCGAPKNCDGSRGRRRLPATQWFRKPNRPKSGWRASHGSHGGTVVTGSDWLEATTLWDDGSTAAGSQ